MKISKEIPPIYEILHNKFGVEWEEGIAIAYGDTVYSKNNLTPDIIIHEQTHLDQQKMNVSPEIWWSRYIDDEDFRLKQEVEAYRAQIKFLRENTNLHSRNARRFLIQKFAMDLSGGMYGFRLHYTKALEMIK